MRRFPRPASAFLLLIGLLGMVAACGRNEPEGPPLGMYRAVLRLPGGDAPFGLEVAQEQQQYVLYLINGTERTRVSNVKVADGELFAPYEANVRHIEIEIQPAAIRVAGAKAAPSA